jgi:branched-chain amino acid transport system ATP-binding protein
LTALLEARGVTVSYGGARANDKIDLSVPAGKLVGLIGANGAGKTTFIDALTGFTPLSAGAIHFDGDEIAGWAPDRRARSGLVRTFQSVELFDDLTVFDNLRVACEDAGLWSLPLQIVRHRPSSAVEEAIGWALAVVGLQHLGDYLPVDLSHGQRKLVGVARALAARPKLLLLDEPAAGLDAEESQELGRVLRGLLDRGVTVLLIDHDMGLVLSVCDHLYVLDFGVVVAAGPPAEIRRNKAVLKAYLGDGAEPAAGRAPTDDEEATA